MSLKKSLFTGVAALVVAVVPAFTLARTPAPASVAMSSTPEVIVPPEFMQTHKSVKTVSGHHKAAKKVSTKLVKHKLHRKHKKLAGRKHLV